MNGATCAGHFCRRHYWAFPTTDEPTSKLSAVSQVPSSAVSFCIDRDITLFHVTREDFALRVSPHFLLVVSLFKIFLGPKAKMLCSTIAISIIVNWGVSDVPVTSLANFLKCI